MTAAVVPVDSSHLDLNTTQPLLIRALKSCTELPQPLGDPHKLSSHVPEEPGHMDIFNSVTLTRNTQSIAKSSR